MSHRNGRSKIRRIGLAAVLTWSCAFAASAEAGDPIEIFDGEFKVNTVSSLNFNPSVDRGPAGNFVVTWLDSSYWVQGQVVASDGTFVGGQFQVNDISVYPYRQEVAMMDEDSFAVVWAEAPMGTNQLTFKVFDATGTEQSENVTVFDNVFEFAATGAGDGAGFWVVWYDNPAFVGQKFSADGAPMIPPTSLFEPGGTPSSVEVDAAPDGGFTVMWTPQFKPRGVSGQRFDADGQAVGVSFQIDSSGQSSTVGDIATNSVGDSFVVWSRAGAPDTEVMGRLVSPDGVPLADEIQFDSEDVSTPRADVGLDDGFLVAWQKGPFFAPSDAYIQAVDRNGLQIGEAQRVSPEAAVVDQVPDVAAVSSEEFLVVWSRRESNQTGVIPADIIGRSFTRAPVATEVPSLGTYGLLILGAALGFTAVGIIRRRI